MKKTKFRGFTLVELLAVIVILAVILVIAIPQIIKVIQSARLSSIKDSAMLIAEQAEKDYLTQQVLNKDYGSSSIPCSDVANLNDDYESCSISYNNGVATVKLKGSTTGKFSGITCEGTKDNMNCNNENVNLNLTAAEKIIASCKNSCLTGTPNENGLVKIAHENGDIDYRYVGYSPKNFVLFNTKTVYQMYADGDVSTNAPRVGYQGGNEFPDEATCINSGLNGSFASVGYEGDKAASCVVNSVTNKYYIEAHGYLGNTNTYDTQRDCENSYSSQGMKNSAIPSGLTCKSKKINGEIWRIIGVFKINGEERIKLIRSESLGNYAWDTSASTGTNAVNGGKGVNEWSQADLMAELNGDYLNSNLLVNGKWFNGSGNTRNAIFDKSKVLYSEAQNLIDNAVWYTGASEYGASLSTQYSNERGTKTCEEDNLIGCIYDLRYNILDNVKRQTTWVGKVGLIYPSDYAYASINESCKKSLDYDADCTSWMFTSLLQQWTITPTRNSPSNVQVTDVMGGVADSFSYKTAGVRPSVYLKTGVRVEGTGTEGDPFVFAE